MMDQNGSKNLTRRNYIKLFASVGGVGTLAGCMGGGGNSSSSGGSNSGNQTLEIQHWWTAGGDGEAMDALLSRFQEKNPDVTINDNPVSGAGGQNLHTVIKERVLNQDPPSTWQDWPGANLKPYIEADVLKDISNTVWTDDMRNAYPESPRNAARAGNSSNPFVAVPLNIHRINNLFYNVELVEQAGVDPGSIDNPEALIDAMNAVESKTSAAGMANSTSQATSTLQMWGDVLLGMYGNEIYQRFINGEINGIEGEIRNSLDIIRQYSEYYTSDAGSINQDEAGYKVANGEAAFMQMGDWQAGNFGTVDGFNYESGWDHVPYPGTQSYYKLNMDAFPFPKPNPSPDATTKFLQFVGTVEAQKLFNPPKGSIPPRSDVPIDDFPPFLQKQIEQYNNANARPPSIAHGLAVPPDTLNSCLNVISRFISGYNVDRAQQRLINAVSNQ